MVSEKELIDNSFNKEQARAIVCPIDRDCLVSAGAGSGKTKTLAEKVYQLCMDNVKPSELLVLTFTDNAAHSMLSKIISRFKIAGKDELAKELAGAHIQTFDSFLNFLVKKYAIYLGVSSQLDIGDDKIFLTKQKVFLDEIFESYYVDDSKKGYLVDLIAKFSLTSDDALKKIILDINNRISNLSFSDRNQYLNHYDELFFSDSFINHLYDLAANDMRNTIIKSIYKAYFYHTHEKEYESNGKNVDINVRIKYFSNWDISNFDYDYRGLDFGNALIQDSYNYLVQILDYDNKKIVDEIVHIDENSDSNILYAKNPKKWDVTNADKLAIKELRKAIYGNESSLSRKYKIFSDIDSEIDKMNSFKDDIHFIFNVCKKLNAMLDEYKFVTNIYSFTDIRNLAMKLFLDESYKKQAEEIREMFNYICIDEYQDSDDIQEVVFESLCKVRKDGTKAHLFCVGDAKQAIYGFKNSNVELFIDRRNKYLSNSYDEVIDMNKNYRSGKPLLNDINYLFNYYMTLSKGGISYMDNSEQLKYDDNVNLYHETYDNFGIKRIVSVTESNYDGRSNINDKRKWEALAIIDDIKKAVGKRLVYDLESKNDKIRTARYSDFCILMRTKSDFEMYQKLFQLYGVPLNNKITTDLKKSNASILIESLIGLISFRLGKNPTADVRHLFASVARSYAYQYSDQKLYDLLTKDIDKNKYNLEEIMNDQIFKDIDTFIEVHKNSAFTEIFIDMLVKFKVFSSLYKIGDISNTLDNIDSLYGLVNTLESSREGIESFVRLLTDMKKYGISLEGDNILHIEDAVDMMTVHASKGLENKIIYLPVMSNLSMSTHKPDKADYIFSKKFGIILPNYSYNINENNGDIIVDTGSYDLLTRKMYDYFDDDKKKELDEHVRLYYVAFTRAQNTVYIVGDGPDCEDNSDRSTQSIYSILESTPYAYYLDGKILNYLSNIEGSKSLLKEYNMLNTALLNVKNISQGATFRHKQALEMIEEIYELDYINELRKKIRTNRLNISFLLYLTLYNRFINDYEMGFSRDDYIRIFSIGMFDVDTIDLDSLQDHISKQHSFDIDIKENGDDFKSFVLEEAYEYVKSIYSYRAPTYCEKDLKDIPDIFKDNLDAYSLFHDLYNVLLRYYFKSNGIYKKSYKNINYKDEVINFDISKMEQPSIKENAILQHFNYDDSIIDYQKLINQRASKRLENNDDNTLDVLSYGTKLHKMMELIDFTNPDVSFIKEEKERNIINKILEMPLFQNLRKINKTDIYTEYVYYDDLYHTTGYVDLFFKDNDEYYIVDYKTKDINDPAYVLQLNSYERNIRKLFKIKDTTKVNLVLVSLIDAKLKIIE